VTRELYKDNRNKCFISGRNGTRVSPKYLELLKIRNLKKLSLFSIDPSYSISFIFVSYKKKLPAQCTVVYHQKSPDRN
jgi:hypothetical protein